MERIVILGGQRSGAGAARLAKKWGYGVFVSDEAEIPKPYKEVLWQLGVAFEEAAHTKARIMASDRIVKSPGIPDQAPIIREARESGIPVMGELEFAAQHSQATLLAITGSNGKTTTATLLFRILEKAGMDVALAGNTGKAFSEALAERDRDYFVLEVSSFQLDDTIHFHPRIGVILNISSDHLERYQEGMAGYIDSKFRITRNQTGSDFLIWNRDDPVLQDEMRKRQLQARSIPFSIKGRNGEGGWVENDQLVIDMNDKTLTMGIHEIALQGQHNTSNSLAAGIAARVLDIRKEAIRECLADFHSIEHRLEQVATVHGISFVNDSKATNINATWYALESTDAPLIWIVGGVDKGNDYSVLEDLVREKVKAIICLAKDPSPIHQAFEGTVETMIDAKSAYEAVAFAYKLGSKGDTTLLSPACASFDLFDDYEDRGKQFKNAVHAL